MHLFGQRPVLQQLHHLVLEYNRTLGGGNVAPHFKCSFIRLRDMAFTHIGKHMHDAARQTLAFRLH